MNLLLSNFNNENSEDLDKLIISYQEYFIFQRNDYDTNLYLNIENLKQYLLQGKEIKYRKFKFLYLENLINKKKNKNYNFNYIKINNKSLNYINHDKILDNFDIKNIKKIISIINYFQKSNLKLKNNNIFKLDNNLYADLKNYRFLNNRYLKNYKFDFKGRGFIVNNYSYLKNLIVILNCIHNTKNNNKHNELLIETKCNLIITSKIKIELFLNVIKSINPEIKYLEISNINHTKNIKYKDIQNLEYLFFNNNLLNNYFKYIDINFDINIKDNIFNSIIEQSYNENYMDNKFNNIFMFEWNNLIIDNFSKLNKNDINYLRYIDVKNYNYINIENHISDDILKDISVFLINNDDLDIYDFNNYKFIIKNDLLICNKNIIKNENHNIINIEKNDESEIISKLNYNKNYEIELAKIFFKSNNRFLYKDNENNIKDIILNKKNNNKYIKNTINNKNNNNFCCICMDRIDNSKFCILDCGHYFCKNCILMHKINEELNNYENKCPVCRNKYNIIYNVIQNENKISSLLNELEILLSKEKNKNIIIVAECNEILKYINDALIDKYEIEYYKKNKNICKIKLVSINYLKKNIIYDNEVFIFFTFSNKAFDKYVEIKNLYNDFYIDKNKIIFYIFNYKK